MKLAAEMLLCYIVQNFKKYEKYSTYWYLLHFRQTLSLVLTT